MHYHTRPKPVFSGRFQFQFQSSDSDKFPRPSLICLVCFSFIQSINHNVWSSFSFETLSENQLMSFIFLLKFPFSFPFLGFIPFYMGCVWVTYCSVHGSNRLLGYSHVCNYDIAFLLFQLHHRNCKIKKKREFNRASSLLLTERKKNLY